MNPPAISLAPKIVLLEHAASIDLQNGVRARYGLCSLDYLKPNPHRVLEHPTRQIKKLARSMDASGFVSPIICDENFVLLAGHARLEAYKKRSKTMVPVIQTFGLSEAQKRMYLIADNRVGLDAKLNREKLAAQLPELTVLFKEVGLTLDDTGFEVAELEQLSVDFENNAADPADIVDPRLAAGPVVSVAGDQFALGNHFLHVGDARDSTAVAALMRGELGAALATDPPYNVRVRDIVGRGQIKHAEFAMASGEMSREAFTAFLACVLGNAAAVLRNGALCYVFIDWKHVSELIEAGRLTFAQMVNLVVWVKTNAGQGGMYRSQHELIGLFRNGDGQVLDNVQQGRFGRSRSNVWQYAGANTFRAGRMDDLAAHPTVKPIALIADALKDCTRRGDTVLDLFSGSGTTILAAERIGRRARALEISPKYVDVAIRRWEQFTGLADGHRPIGKRARTPSCP